MLVVVLCICLGLGICVEYFDFLIQAFCTHFIVLLFCL